MPDPAPLTTQQKIAWGAVVALCAVTVVVLWIAASRLKAAKIEARRGTAPVFDADGSAVIRLVAAESPMARFAHFEIALAEGGAVVVSRAGGAPCVEYRGIRDGAVRRWQELQLTFADVTDPAVRLKAELKPGAPCFGPGRYRDLRAGLRIELAAGHSVTLLHVDRARREVRVEVETTDGKEEASLTATAPERRTPTLVLRVTATGPLELHVEEP